MSMNPSAVRVINPILTTHVQGYRQPDLVGDALFPAVPVDVTGGQVLEFGKEAFMQYVTRRAPGTGTKRITFGFQGKPYALFNDALEAPVPREYLRDAKLVPGIDLATRATNLVMNVLLRNKEVEQAEIALNAANYDANHKIALSGTDKWSDAASDPISQVEDYKEAVRATIGLYPNTLLLSAQAWRALKTNPKIKDQFKYTTPDAITTAMVAALFELDRVVVGKGISSTDAGVFSDIWGNNAVLAYVPLKPSGMEEPSYGYTYTLTGHPLVEEPYYDNNAKSWIYGVGYERAPVLTGITGGFLIQAPK